MSKRLIMVAMTVALGIGGAMVALGQDPQQPEQRQTERTQSDKTQTKGTASGSINNNDQRFIREAAEGGKAEVALGNLALQKASSEEVKQFAQRMVDDHSKANQELTELAAQKGVSLQPGMAAQASTATGAVREGVTTDPSATVSSATQSGRTAVTGQAGELTGKHKQLYDRLSRLSGAEFDREYMKEMVKDHNKDVAAFEKASEKSQDPDLKAWVTKTLPTLREHQQQARDVEAKVGGKSSDKSSDKSSQPTQPTRNP